VKRLYPSYEPKQKKYERIPLNYRNKKPVRAANDSVGKTIKAVGQSQAKESVSS